MIMQAVGERPNKCHSWRVSVTVLDYRQARCKRLLCYLLMTPWHIVESAEKSTSAYQYLI